MWRAVRHIEPPAWMRWKETGAVLAALQAGGARVRFVGGCVRDAVLGLDAKDIDLATPEPPETVMQRLRAAGLRAIPTGIEHGTVTAVVDHRHFEVTTLRADVETFGRRATVAFTDDWEGDAARRDFTINALYADPGGGVYDPTGGLADLDAGRVRFVGRAAERIAEDRLRVLRFFRFHARFGRIEPDGEALAACRDGAAGLEILSAERVAAELLRLLAVADPAPTVALMASLGVLARILPEASGADRLAALVRFESAHDRADALRRLSALLPGGEPAADSAADRLRLSNSERERLRAMALAPIPASDSRAMRRQLYRLGATLFRDRVLLAWAGGEIADGAGALTAAAAWVAPVFPLRGSDALALGQPAGPRVGEALRAVEKWWEENDYRDDRDACLQRLRALLVS